MPLAYVFLFADSFFVTSTPGYSASSCGSSIVSTSTCSRSTVSREMSRTIRSTRLLPRGIVKLWTAGPLGWYSSIVGDASGNGRTSRWRCSTSCRWSRLALRSCRSTISMYLNASPFSAIRCARPFTRNFFVASSLPDLPSPSNRSTSGVRATAKVVLRTTSRSSGSTRSWQGWYSLVPKLSARNCSREHLSVLERRVHSMARRFSKAAPVRPERRWF